MGNGITSRARLRLFGAALWILMMSSMAARADGHSTIGSADAWTALLQRCVTETADGHSTAVDYDCFKGSSEDLNRYLDQLSAVTTSQFDAWSRDEQLAFLINAYNAITGALILQAWPDLE